MASGLDQPCFCTSAFIRGLGSPDIGMSPASIEFERSSPRGCAVMQSRLCLLGDLAKHGTAVSPCTVSRYETTGSPAMTGPLKYSVSRSCKATDKCNSPDAAITCSPDSLKMTSSNGSDFERRFSASIIFGRSDNCFGLTDTCTTGATAYCMGTML